MELKNNDVLEHIKTLTEVYMLNVTPTFMSDWSLSKTINKKMVFVAPLKKQSILNNDDDK